MRFFTTEQLSENMFLTPEGFLLCVGVPIARTGMQLYGPHETPVTPGADGLSRVWRDEEEVFDPDFLASINGKSVVDDHPTVDVNPDNWRELTVGVAFNPRRGDGDKSDLLLADLLITDKFAISEVQAGKREISVGYDAEYTQIGPGEGRQYDMIANHIALVHLGRCGNRCSIGDEAMTIKQLKEKLLKKLQDGSKPEEAVAVLDELTTAPQRARTTDCGDGEETDDRRRGAKDEEDTEDARGTKQGKRPAVKVSASDGEEDTEDTEDRGRRFSKARARYTDAALDARFSKIEDTLDKILDRLDSKKSSDAKSSEDTEDRRRGAKDSVDEDLVAELPVGIRVTSVHDSSYLEDSFQETVATAEMIVPGVRIPTYDSKADPRRTLDTMCNFRKQVLDLAYNQPATRGVIDEILRGRDFDTKSMNCQKARDMFFSVGLFAKNNNNKRNFTPQVGSLAGTPVIGTVKSISDLNKLNQQRYSKQ